MQFGGECPRGFPVQYQRSEGQRRELGRDAGGVWSLESRTGRGQKVTLDTNPEMPITPKDTVARLLELAEAGDWETYVNDYYGEAHKFRAVLHQGPVDSPEAAVRAAIVHEGKS